MSLERTCPPELRNLHVTNIVMRTRDTPSAGRFSRELGLGCCTSMLHCSALLDHVMTGSHT
jgi:hypothetical protein